MCIVVYLEMCGNLQMLCHCIVIHCTAWVGLKLFLKVARLAKVTCNHRWEVKLRSKIKLK